MYTVEERQTIALEHETLLRETWSLGTTLRLGASEKSIPMRMGVSYHIINSLGPLTLAVVISFLRVF